MECVMNPFGNSVGGPSDVAAFPCDGVGRGTHLLTVTGVSGFSGATATKGIIRLNGECSGDQSLEVTYGAASVTDPGTAQTSVAEAFSNESVNFASLCPAGTKLRVVSAGLKVNLLAGANDRVVTLTPYLSEYTSRTAAGTYVTNKYLLRERLAAEGKYGADGITVRRPWDRVNPDFHEMSTAIYLASALNANGNMPVVVFSDLDADASLIITWVVHYQVMPFVDDWPFRLRDTPWELEWDKMVHHVNTSALIASGHSFKSFIRNMFKGVEKGVRFVSRQVPKIIETGEEILGTAAMIAPFVL